MAEEIEGVEYFKNAVKYNNPELARLSQRLYDP